MQIEYKESFKKDLKKAGNKNVYKKILIIIKEIEQAHNIHQIHNIIKLRGTDNFFRIKVGDYRIGIIINDDKVIFVRMLHRREIYRYFP